MESWVSDLLTRAGSRNALPGMRVIPMLQSPAGVSGARKQS